MDRVSVRSFRAHDLAERGLKDLARSRLDTTREVVFQPLGARFFEAREDVARLANLFREDAFLAPAGNFARLTLRVEPHLVERLSVLEPRAVESRLEEAARNAIAGQPFSMSDDASVASALRSSARLVVIEAPAGCGKTYQGAQYARDASATIGNGRVLILTHTHAACDVFAAQTRRAEGRVEIRTIDSVIGEIAGAYHQSLGLPVDIGTWARTRDGGYDDVARRVATLLRASPMIGRALAERYPVVVCDEHQDASADQHATAMAFHGAGSSLRVFGDPMQRIYGSKSKAERDADKQRWEDLKQKAEAFEELEEPHRWGDGSRPLGEWILSARAALRAGGRVELRSPPPGVSVIVAENQSPKARGGYQLSKEDGEQIYALVKARGSILVLAAYNDTVSALRAFFGRRLPIWEGHVRDGLSALVASLNRDRGTAGRVAEAVVAFLGHVATGFSPSAYGNVLVAEVTSGCTRERRSGKPATLQGLGRLLLEEPDHKGVAKVLRRVTELVARDSAFKGIHFDYHRELWDAVRLGEFEDPNEGLVEIARRRSHARPSLPARAISTIHKAKGLECSDALIMPCDAPHFGDTDAARCELYVAMSRARRSLTVVVSRDRPSPLVAM